jgi:Tfp pilus assembly protein PilN
LWALGSAELGGQERRLQALRRVPARVATGLDMMDDKALKPIATELKEQIQFLTSVIEGRPRVAAKLDALARSLPAGVWLTSLAFNSKPDAKGKSAGQLTLQGACFLGASDKELKAIQEFEANVKRDMKLVQDMRAVRLGKIDAAVGAHQTSSYRTFELQCQSTGKL